MEVFPQENTIAFWQSQGCQLMRFDMASDRPVVLDKLLHDEISIIAFTGSVWNSLQNRQRYQETPDSIVLRDAGQVYSVRSESITPGAVCRELRIAPAKLQELFENTDARVPTIDFRNPVLTNPSLHWLLMQTHEVMENSKCELETSSRLAILIEQIVRHASRMDAPPAPKRKCFVRDIIDYLRAHYARQITLKELASLTQCNPFVLIRQFRKEVGVTPHEYLHIYRVSRAKCFIHEGFTLMEVAQLCGFSDQSHLTRLFKRKVGAKYSQRSWEYDWEPLKAV